MSFPMFADVHPKGTVNHSLSLQECTTCRLFCSLIYTNNFFLLVNIQEDTPDYKTVYKAV